MAGAIGQTTKRGGSRSVANGGVRLLVAALAATLYLFYAAPANAAGKYAAMVIDANTGNVISAHAADEPRYPASLTKMMTLYVVFDLIEQGVREAIREEFVSGLGRPELLGRFGGADSIVLFDYLRDLDKVCRKFVANIGAYCKRVHGVELTVDDSVIVG